MLKLLAALYVAGVLTWGAFLIRKADKYVWPGIAYGLIWAAGTVLFGFAAMYLWKGPLR